MYDICVVGAGPGGSYVSHKLSKSGFSTILLEAEKLPRYKPCGGAIPEELVSELKLPKDIIEREFEYLDLHFKDQIIHRAGKGVVVWRDIFDYYISEMAVNSGTILKDKNPCINVIKSNGTFKIKTPSDTYESKFLIAADGCNSTVLSSLNWKRFNPDEIALTVQYEMNMPKEKIDKTLGADIIHLFFGKNICERGYGWIFPKEKIISVGWGSQLSLITNTTKEFNNFIRLIKKYIKDATIIKKVAHLVPTDVRERLYDDNLFVIGDAAGFVDPLSGKGIIYSILSGNIAASVIKKHFNEKDRVILEKEYNKKLNSIFLNILKKKKSIQADVYSSDESILRFITLWKNHRSSDIALNLWK
jgi:geranylgeranyl reductase family protein